MDKKAEIWQIKYFLEHYEAEAITKDDYKFIEELKKRLAWLEAEDGDVVTA